MTATRYPLKHSSLYSVEAELIRRPFTIRLLKWSNCGPWAPGVATTEPFGVWPCIG